MAVSKPNINTLELPRLHRKYSMAWTSLHHLFDKAITSSEKYADEWPVPKSVPLVGSRIVLNDLSGKTKAERVQAKIMVAEHESGLKVITADFDNPTAQYHVIDGFDVHEVGVLGKTVGEDVPQCRGFGIAFDRFHVTGFTLGAEGVADELSTLTSLALAKTAFTRTLEYI